MNKSNKIFCKMGDCITIDAPRLKEKKKSPKHSHTHCIPMGKEKHHLCRTQANFRNVRIPQFVIWQALLMDGLIHQCS
jgi:hypothetical protein